MKISNSLISAAKILKIKYIPILNCNDFSFNNKNQFKISVKKH